ncbi:MAG TPA: LptE family protein [Elusimicrobiota bacterium]|nr:LptE family protein [Elusimicrobiota bacterium]
MRPLILLAAAALAACAGLRPSGPPPRPLPASIRTLSLPPIVNKSQEPGLEDPLALALRDEFLRDGRRPLVPEKDSDGAVQVAITRYLLTPLQYDANQNPTTYLIRVNVEVQLFDRAAKKTLWDEKGLEASLAYPNASLTGGLTEQAAQAQLWPVLAPMIVARVIDGYGATAAPEPKPAPPGP